MVSQSALLAAPGQKLRLPVAVIVTNQSPPVGDAPSLMTMEYVLSKLFFCASIIFWRCAALQILKDCTDRVALRNHMTIRINQSPKDNVRCLKY